MQQCRACGQEHTRGGNLCLDCAAAALENDGDRYTWIGEEADQLRAWALEDMERRHEAVESWRPMQDTWHEDRNLGGEPL